MLFFTQPKSLKGSKTFFWVKISFNSFIIINQSQMHHSEKVTKQLTVRGGGGNPYGHPDRKIYLFVIDDFPYNHHEHYCPFFLHMVLSFLFCWPNDQRCNMTQVLRIISLKKEAMSVSSTNLYFQETKKTQGYWICVYSQTMDFNITIVIFFVIIIVFSSGKLKNLSLKLWTEFPKHNI